MASLSDGAKKVIFPLGPESIKMMVTGDYALNSVLNTNNPRIRPKSSATVHKLSRCLLMSANGKEDQQPFINTIQYWAKQQVRLAFNSDSHILKMCYIRSLELSVKMWKAGKPVYAEMEIELIEASPDVSTVKLTAAKTTAKKITPREQANKKATIKTKLKTPTKQKTLGLLSSNFDIEVLDDDSVKIYYEGVSKTYGYDELIGKIS